MSAPPRLPLGFADQVLELEIKLEDEESLEVIQILSQMYRVLLVLISDSCGFLHRNRHQESQLLPKKTKQSGHKVTQCQ